MLADEIGQDFIAQAVDGAACASDAMQHILAAGIFLQEALDALWPEARDTDTGIGGWLTANPRENTEEQ